MPRLQFRGEQSERGNYRKLGVVIYCDKLRSTFRIYLRNCCIVPWIDLDDLGVFINNLRLVIAHFVNLVRDLFEVRLPYHNANQFVSTEFESTALDLFCRPSLIGERIERKVKVVES